jgi:Domain of unknown function (DUF5664)
VSLLPTDDKARKEIPVFSYLVRYFPKALLAVVGVCVAGNKQHNPEMAATDINWTRGKSSDQMNTAQRHMLDYGTGTKKDVDGQWHLAKAIWRLSAQLQLDIEQEEAEKAPLTSGVSGILVSPNITV